MKVLTKKLKRANKFCLSLFNISTLLYIVTLIIFIISLLSLKGIETIIRLILIILFIIWLLVYIFTGLIKLVKRKYKLLVIFSIITILLSIVFGVGSYVINFAFDKLQGITESSKVTYTSYLISMNETNYSKDIKLGMISDETEIEGYELANKLIKKEKLSNEIVSYDDYDKMIYDLYNNNIDAIFVPSNYKSLFSNDENYANIDGDTKELYSYSEERKNEDTKIVSNKKLTEPFSMLIMGVDSTKDGLNANAAFNGDTLILITFNPKTLTATMFSIPRDTYVPIACKNNKYAKINSSAAHSTKCVIDTVQNLTDINIDYYVKINFQGVVDLVDAVGGVTVNVEKPDYASNSGTNCNGKVCEQNSKRQWGKNTVFINTGVQKLNGEQALAYSRCRHLYAQSDLARNRHQQDVITALAKEAMKIKNLSEIEDVLDAISNNIATNMSTDQILSSYKILKDMLEKSLKDEEMINIKKSYLEVFSLPVNTGYRVTSALGHYQDSLDEITNMMKTNLEITDNKSIKTFKYDINEDYSSKVYGKGIKTGEHLSLLPNFVGTSVADVRTWASSNGISLTVNGNGKYVTSQSLPKSYLVKNIQSLSVDTGSTAIQVIEEATETTDTSEENIEQNID